ncbi:GBF-interacting protein 1-like [Zingiber officinale]|uniref:GBF-interacting protein 1-like n=1 Tax=Zingiber officinale TaxID=94328 RepID=UPI001C4A7AAC|nr:GBF-interacting protein 1-like [Zingiber officinale]XP_042383361.1 GBF-interacting protein 1-like [Zingiber officinale]
MTAAGDGTGGRVNGQAATIPSGSRKLVQSLKEIVNCSEPEIYAMLRECNMDPNEAVQCLLSQDTFQEVKSKRDKKKEVREFPKSRSQTVNTNSGHGSKGSSDHRGRHQSSLTDKNHGIGTAEHHRISNYYGWSLVQEQPAESVLTTMEITSPAYTNPSELAAPNLMVVCLDLQIDPCSEDIQDHDGRASVKPQPIESRPISASERQLDVETSEDASYFDDRLLSMDSYQSVDLEFNCHKAEDGLEISSTAATLRQLSVHGGGEHKN